MGGKGKLRVRAAISVLAAVFFLLVAPVVGDGLNQQPLPASPLTPPTVAASVGQSAAAQVAGSARDRRRQESRAAPHCRSSPGSPTNQW